MRSLCALVVVSTLGLSAVPEARADNRQFEAGSLIIPMDQAYQNHGMLQAYGLLFQLLRQGVRAYWVIDQNKTWHALNCNNLGDPCPWDCAEEGSGVKCPYPTASPDFYTGTTVVWDGEGLQDPGDSIANHGYRGGPFVIDAADHDAAIAIIDAWNDPAQWAANPWAERSVFHVVTVHEAAAAFTGWVRKEMIAAPTIAVFADGNEKIANGYIRAAGIPQSNGLEFPDSTCGTDDCGPGTDNPDMLIETDIMGDLGTCDAPNYDHENGALFNADGLPAFCQIMSMHWAVTDREKVTCAGGCPALQTGCTGQAYTWNGHEVVAEVRRFLDYPVHFFAECQAVNAYENTVPNPDWPFLDDDGRLGHFLTTQGSPPACTGSCADGDFQCVADGCGAGMDCCLPKDIKEKGAGFMIAAQPATNTLRFFHPEVPYAQLDGVFASTGGSEPAYNLSDFLGTMYINDRDVTFISGPNGPGDQDVWMTGYKDGACDLSGGDDVAPPTGQCNGGKVSYLGGHQYDTNVPMTSNTDSQGARMFLNALFEADCVTSLGQPSFDVNFDGDLVLSTTSVPVDSDYLLSFTNLGRGPGYDAVLAQAEPAGVELADYETPGDVSDNDVSWTIGSVSGNPPLAGDPPNAGARSTTLRFSDYGDYVIEVGMTYRVGQSLLTTAPRSYTISVIQDRDGDGVSDGDDPFPDDPNACGDSDQDTCDDCTSGSFDPADDGPDADADGICDAGDDDGNPDDGNASGGCCRTGRGPVPGGGVLIAGLTLLLAARRRRPRA